MGGGKWWRRATPRRRELLRKICKMMRAMIGLMVDWEEKAIDFAGDAIVEAGRPAATSWRDGRGVCCSGRNNTATISGSE